MEAKEKKNLNVGLNKTDIELLVNAIDENEAYLLHQKVQHGALLSKQKQELIEIYQKLGENKNEKE